ncbi:MAG: sugar phosphate isomerase/epimerase [Candidatus Coatesbacteria bacterium]
MQTRTGGFGIGFRRGWSGWNKDLPGVIAYAKANGFEGIDVGRDGDAAGKTVAAAGLRVGSVDLAEWNAMLSPDAGKRKAAIEKNTAYVKACAVLGPVNHFLVMLPEDAAKPRSENFGYMVESFAALAPVLEAAKASLAIEGWPGPGALVCTPEGFRAFFKAVPSKAMGINFDPSHLIRMGIDPMRFLREFATQVVHVHGKDTALYADALYEFGHEQPATFGKGHGFGDRVWRYTIPGHGVMNWPEAFGVLAGAGYRGMVSIELEDENFNDRTETEQAGLLAGGRFLEGC